jgi:hypothetical protein
VSIALQLKHSKNAFCEKTSAENHSHNYAMARLHRHHFQIAVIVAAVLDATAGDGLRCLQRWHRDGRLHTHRHTMAIVTPRATEDHDKGASTKATANGQGSRGVRVEGQGRGNTTLHTSVASKE